MGRYNDILAKIASHSDWHGVAEDHAEAFLINRVLRFGLGDLLFSGISFEHVFEIVMGYEIGSDSVNVHSLLSLFIQSL